MRAMAMIIVDSCWLLLTVPDSGTLTTQPSRLVLDIRSLLDGLCSVFCVLHTFTVISVLLQFQQESIHIGPKNWCCAFLVRLTVAVDLSSLGLWSSNWNGSSVGVLLLINTFQSAHSIAIIVIAVEEQQSCFVVSQNLAAMAW